MTLSTGATAFIAGRQPMLAVHRSFRDKDFPTMLRHLRARTADVTNGVVISLSTHNDGKARSEMGDAASADVRLADPQLWKHDTSGWPGVDVGKPKTAWKRTWWTAALPHAAKSDPAWATRILETQLSVVGANMALSATGWVDSANARQSLDDALRWVQVSRSVLGEGVPMFVNLTFDHVWLSNPILRSMLLTEIVESSEDMWYLRFCWPKPMVRYGQLTNPDVLLGYQELCQVAADEGKRVVLANSGLTGWVATALGAAGFSTGTSWPEQAHVMESPMGGNGGPPKERYFDRNLLHTVERPTYLRIARSPAHVACACTYSSSLARGAVWDFQHAGYHYLMNAGDLTQQIARATDPRAQAQATVTAAATFAGSLSGATALAGADRPLHLPGWGKALV